MAITYMYLITKQMVQKHVDHYHWTQNTKINKGCHAKFYQSFIEWSQITGNCCLPFQN